MLLGLLCQRGQSSARVGQQTLVLLQLLTQRVGAALQAIESLANAVEFALSAGDAIGQFPSAMGDPGPPRIQRARLRLDSRKFVVRLPACLERRHTGALVGFDLDVLLAHLLAQRRFLFARRLQRMGLRIAGSGERGHVLAATRELRLQQHHALGQTLLVPAEALLVQRQLLEATMPELHALHARSHPATRLDQLTSCRLERIAHFFRLELELVVLLTTLVTAGARRLELGGQFFLLGQPPGQFLGEARILGAAHAQANIEDPGLELLVALCLQRLVLDRTDTRVDLSQHILQAGEILIHPIQAAQGLLALALELADARRLLEQKATILGAGLQQAVHLALLHHRVGVDADTGVHEELTDILQPAAVAIEQIFALARAVQLAADGHFRHVGRQATHVVDEGQGDLGMRGRPSILGPVKNDIHHVAAAQMPRIQLAQHPADRIDDVALATAIGAHDRGDARAKLEGGLVGEGLEAVELEAV